jgi:hypothetical protein
MNGPVAASKLKDIVVGQQHKTKKFKRSENKVIS